jgi:hypothetical protein
VSRPPAWSPRSFLHRKVAKLEALLQQYEQSRLVIGSLWHAVAAPVVGPVIFAGVLWTFTVEAWNAVQEQIAARPAPGPLRRAFLRESSVFIARHRDCGGFESGFTDGMTWMACRSCGVRVERRPVPDGA